MTRALEYAKLSPGREVGIKLKAPALVGIYRENKESKNMCKTKADRDLDQLLYEIELKLAELKLAVAEIRRIRSERS